MTPFPTHTVKKISAPVNWSAVPVLPIDCVCWEPDFGIRAKAQLCHDGENLYLRMRAVEKDVRAENTAPLSPVYEDSCLEFFFMRADGKNYFNFEINPNGRLCIQYGPSRNDRTYLVRSDDTAYFDIHTECTSDGWEARYRIPLAFLRTFDPAFEYRGALRANFYKCGDKTVHPHFLSWAPMTSKTPDFHRPEDFGTLWFSD